MSNAPVIEVENLGKRYLLGVERGAARASLREALMQKLKAPLRWGRATGETTGEFWALQEVNFSVQQGEVVGIIGRNGAGKSTLLKILSRITEPTTGRVKLHGRVGSLLEVGTGFHGELSGRENIFLNGAILGMTRAEIQRKFDEIVAFAEVEKFLDTPVKRYSSGMYVRLAFAVAAHLEPEILIVDEVLAVGDQEFQRKCLGKIQSVTRNEGRTVLFVSHNLASVRQLCSRAILLEHGRVACIDQTAEVIRHYVNSSASAAGASQGYRHVQGDGRARIQRIKLYSASGGEPIYAIFEPVKVEFTYELKGDPIALEFFVLLYADDGECVAASFQRDSGADFTRPAGATGTVTLTFQNSLAPGRYLISAGIFDGNRNFTDWIEFGESFVVESSFANGRGFDGRLGRFTLNAEWKTQ